MSELKIVQAKIIAQNSSKVKKMLPTAIEVIVQGNCARGPPPSDGVVLEHLDYLHMTLV